MQTGAHTFFTPHDPKALSKATDYSHSRLLRNSYPSSFFCSSVQDVFSKSSMGLEEFGKTLLRPRVHVQTVFKKERAHTI